MTRELVREAQQALGVRRLLLAVHDAALPADPRDELGRGAPFSRGGRAFLEFAAELGFHGLQLGPQADRLESEPPEFHHAVASAYDRLAAEEPGRWVRLDARQPRETLLEDVLAHVEPLLKEVSRSS